MVQMDSDKFATISPDRRFKIIESTPKSSGDHFYPESDMEWTLKTAKGKTLHTFYGDWSKPDTIHSVKFSKDGKEVLARNKKGRIVERVDLSQF
jgi:hypothetical protein